MINKETIKYLESLDPNYVIGGSVAVMLYLGYDIRKCNDLDIHILNHIDDSNCLKQLVGKDVHIQYDHPEFSIISGINVLKLEDIITYKINRLMLNDIYDLSYLLKLNYDINKIKITSKKEIRGDDYIFDDKSDFYEVLNFENAKGLIDNLRIKISNCKKSH